MEQKVSYTKALMILFGVLLAGQLLFLAAGFYVVHNKLFEPVLTDKDSNSIILATIYGLIFSLAYFGYNIYRNKTRRLRESSISLSEKLNGYRAANLIRWAMLEGPVLLLIVAGIITGDRIAFIGAGVVIILFIFTKPSPEKAQRETGLSEEELNAAGPIN